MPKSAKPRKAYRPRGVNPTSHAVAITGASLLSIDDRTIWALQLDDAITAVGRGDASVGHWTTLFNAVALAEQLVRDRLATDSGGVVSAAQQACVDILQRTGTRSVRSKELTALRNLQEDWISMLEGITHAQKFRAEERIELRKTSPHNVKVPRPCH